MGGRYLPSTRVARLSLLLVVFILHCQPGSGKALGDWWNDFFNHDTDSEEYGDYDTDSEEYGDYDTDSEEYDYYDQDDQQEDDDAPDDDEDESPKEAPFRIITIPISCPRGKEQCGERCCNKAKPERLLTPWWYF
ncbi:uncharacterized protein LOC122365365 [Amphibalanus amphitrite]|uniref:uncharacterized protein LOC122365365 n=1 Tax=Amphibalanus amphitrite TaxID=1232801 RepID=UPI001C9165C7|nr:uncharacterized protein LOC122365365 [Amphibalanus amphitrite]